VARKKLSTYCCSSVVSAAYTWQARSCSCPTLQVTRSRVDLRGLLLRGGGEVLERLAGLKAVALDKTGTVTLGGCVAAHQCGSYAGEARHTSETSVLLSVQAAAAGKKRLVCHRGVRRRMCRPGHDPGLGCRRVSHSARHLAVYHTLDRS
jgi:hypothetical protein